MLFNLIGSLGLFLLGMWLMTEGLKMAGGKALQNILGKWTSSRQRGLATGVGITALVQSSSAVTVATIGFVNAGLMSFQQALWVVFGSNVGTTFTAWIVTFFGFTISIDAYTFPLIGIGAALRIFSPYERGKALGMALAGFGLLFMGIDSLQESFSHHAHEINIEAIINKSSHTTLLALVIGFTLTLLTQSSSAAIAIILTAVASGVSGIEIAAAAVIGANIGTTSTALLSTIGATANAKRLALAHVAFNIITAIVAFMIMPLFLSEVFFLTDMLGSETNMMLMLAIFHTSFNVLGIIVIWPLEPYLSKLLLKLFREPGLKKTPSTHLDNNVATIPDFAIEAMKLELADIINSTSKLLLPTELQTTMNAEQIHELEHKLDALEAFVALTFKSELTQNQATLLTTGLSSSYYLKNACKTFHDSIEQYQASKASSPFAEQELKLWFHYVNENMQLIQTQSSVQAELSLQTLKENYQTAKMKLLKAAISKKIAPDILDNALQAASLSRRFIEQMSQAYAAFEMLNHNDPAPTENTASKENDTENSTEKNTEIPATETPSTETPSTETPSTETPSTESTSDASLTQNEISPEKQP